jgi:hypothetical protein
MVIQRGEVVGIEVENLVIQGEVIEEVENLVIPRLERAGEMYFFLWMGGDTEQQ